MSFFPKTPKYAGSDQPGPCEHANDGLITWLVGLIGALLPSTPAYADAPVTKPAGSGGAPASPTPSNGARANADQAIAHLIRALFSK